MHINNQWSLVMRFRFLTGTGLVLICIAASAQHLRQSTTKPSDNVPVCAPGVSSCGAWLDAREGAEKNKNDVRQLQFEAYLLGFASAYNWYVGDAPSPKGILGETDMYAQRPYLDKYCRDNPTKSLLRQWLTSSII